MAADVKEGFLSNFLNILIIFQNIKFIKMTYVNEMLIDSM